ncbi:MAG: hypothetical protein PVG41_15315 [Desulfobacteraceae bacterium]|jgi:uncharacterized protein YaaN involved in tellurite resistance
MAKPSMQEQILRASKEIAVKFIEVGRLSPSSFNQTFKDIYQTIESTVRLEESDQTDQEP